MFSSTRTSSILALRKRATKKLKMSTMILLQPQPRIRSFLQTLKQNIWKDWYTKIVSLQFIKFSVAEIELVTCCIWGHILTLIEMTPASFDQWSMIIHNGTEHIFFYMRNSKFDDCTHEHRNVSEGKQILIMWPVNAIFDLFIFKQFFAPMSVFRPYCNDDIWMTLWGTSGMVKADDEYLNLNMSMQTGCPWGLSFRYVWASKDLHALWRFQNSSKIRLEWGRCNMHLYFPLYLKPMEIRMSWISFRY